MRRGSRVSFKTGLDTIISQLQAISDDVENRMESESKPHIVKKLDKIRPKLKEVIRTVESVSNALERL